MVDVAVRIASNRLAFTLFLIGVECVFGGGCRRHTRPIPRAYPVHGKVQHKDGTPLRGGSVEFQPEANPYVTSVATIGEDGSYCLRSLVDGASAEGGVPGSNRVIVTPMAPAASTPPVEPGTLSSYAGIPVFLAKPRHIELTDNEINLTLE